MKINFKTPLTVLLSLSFGILSAQTTQSLKKGKTIHYTKVVSFTETETDNSPEEFEKFDRYIKKNIKPISGVHGTVSVKFTVKTNGTLSNITITKSLGKLADAETLRLLKAYKNWTPNKDNGKPISSVITTSVSFK